MTFILSGRSLNTVEGVDSRLVACVHRAIELTSVDFGVTEGLRSRDRQMELYEKGAAYVILPRFLGNEYITTHIKRYGMDKSSFDNFRARHIISIGKEAVKNT